LVASVAAAEVRIAHPNLDYFPPAQLQLVLGQLATLETQVGDWIFAPGPVAWDWGSYELSRFTGGRLSALGYEVRLARSGNDWWVLVQVLTQGEEIWVPVVPGYPEGKSEQRWKGSVLGHVPLLDRGGKLFFQDRYCTWEELLPLPPNTPPVAVIRAVNRWGEVGEVLRFLGVSSYDPDGTIVKFLWDFGDGGRGYGMNESHSYNAPGTYTVTLTVVDAGGLSSQASFRVSIYEESSVSSSPGCRCGGK